MLMIVGLDFLSYFNHPKSKSRIPSLPKPEEAETPALAQISRYFCSSWFIYSCCFLDPLVSCSLFFFNSLT